MGKGRQREKRKFFQTKRIDVQRITMQGMMKMTFKQKNIIYGDFYFTEAILKLKGSDFLIW